MNFSNEFDDFIFENEDIDGYSIIEISDLDTLIQYQKECDISNAKKAKKTKKVKFTFLKKPSWTLVNRDADIERRELSAPYWWGFSYIYDKNSIVSESNKVKESYLKLRDDFFNGIYYNLDSESNYAFTLFYDIIGSYKYHHNFTNIENQLYVLGLCCNKVNNYTISELLKIARKYDIDNNRTPKDPLGIKELHSYYPNSREWDYKELCKIIYGVKGQDATFFKFIELLGWNFNHYDNPQLNHILFHLYLDVIKESIRETYICKVDFDKALLSLKKHQNFTYYHEGRSSVLTLYSAIYTICVNCLFGSWGVSDRRNYYARSTILAEGFYNSRIIRKLTTIVESKVSEIGIIPKDIEVYVNKNVHQTRWKDRYSLIAKKYIVNSNIDEYLTLIEDLTDRNLGNTHIKHLHWESMRLLHKTHKVITLNSYLKYIQINASEIDGIEKSIPKYITKKIFTSSEQQEEFNEILRLFRDDFNLKKAEVAIEQLYLQKKRGLNIDFGLISKTEHRYSQTVKLLSQVLAEDEPEEEPLESQCLDQVIVNSESSGLFNEVQGLLLNLFVNNNYILSLSQVSEYSKSKGVMANRLVSAINESAYDMLDDNLIEMDEDNYQLIEEYYKMLQK